MKERPYLGAGDEVKEALENKETSKKQIEDFIVKLANDNALREKMYLDKKIQEVPLANGMILCVEVGEVGEKTPVYFQDQRENVKDWDRSLKAKIGSMNKELLDAEINKVEIAFPILFATEKMWGKNFGGKYDKAFKFSIKAPKIK